jgi:hypothetical protein
MIEQCIGRGPMNSILNITMSSLIRNGVQSFKDGVMLLQVMVAQVIRTKLISAISIKVQLDYCKNFDLES